MSDGSVTCPVCKYGRDVEEQRIDRSTSRYSCPVCGVYEMPCFLPEVSGEPKPNRKLSGWIREQNELGQHAKFTEERTVQDVLADIPDYRPSEKQLKLLKAIERRSDPPGKEVVLNADKDIPLAYATDSSELAFHIRALAARELLMSVYTWKVTIEPAGWDYLDRYTSDLQEKTQGFVAMSFSDGMKQIWKNAIKPAIEEAGYTPYRVDEDLHSDNIIFKIMAEIKDSRFVVADLTEQRNGVYFEAGYGLGLGLPVIWTIRKDDVKNVHFDTAQYNQIRWESAEELKEALSDYISAIIGKRNQARR